MGEVASMPESEIPPWMDGEGDDEILRARPVSERRTVAVARSQISWVERDKRTTVVHTVSGESFVVRETLTSLEQRWSKHGFMRIHDSFLVFVPHVRELRRLREPRVGRGYVVRLEFAEAFAELQVSRRKVAEIKQKLKG